MKVLVHDDKVIMDLHLRGLPCTESRLCEIRSLGSRSASLGRFPLDRGTGYYNACYYAGDMDGAGLSVFDITGLQIALDERYLKYLLLIVLPVVAFVMLRQKKFPEEKGVIRPWLQRTIVWSASFVVGAYDGFYGPGTGTFLLLIFCNFAKMDLRTASGNVKVVNFSSNIGALATSLMAGKVLIPVGLIAAVFSIAGHYLGAGMTIKNGAKIVRPVIFVVLALLAVKVVLELIGV